VRDAHLFFRVNHGNLIQFSAITWRSRRVTCRSARSSAVLMRCRRRSHWPTIRATSRSPTRPRTSVKPITVWRSCWSTARPGRSVINSCGAFILTGNNYDAEVWVDAHSGDVVNVINRTDTIDGTVRGGIYPNTNTAGTEDLRALPFINVVNGGLTKTADASGVYDYAPAGSLAKASLSGPYIVINDSCGQSSALDVVASGRHDVRRRRRPPTVRRRAWAVRETRTRHARRSITSISSRRRRGSISTRPRRRGSTSR